MPGVAAITQIARQIMLVRVAAVRELAIAGELITVVGTLDACGRSDAQRS
jgi:hypothetical protein